LQGDRNGKERLVTRPAAEQIRLGSASGQGDNELGRRLREIRGGRSREQFGDELNKTHRNTIERYEKGQRVHVPRDFLMLVIEKNPSWSLEWLERGRGDKHVSSSQPQQHVMAQPTGSYGISLDDQLLANVMREIEEAFGKNYGRVSTEKRAALIAAVYEDARARGQVSRDTVLRLMKLASFP
jgi:hypothetical protein